MGNGIQRQALRRVKREQRKVRKRMAREQELQKAKQQQQHQSQMHVGEVWVGAQISTPQLDSDVTARPTRVKVKKKRPTLAPKEPDHALELLAATTAAGENPVSPSKVKINTQRKPSFSLKLAEHEADQSPDIPSENLKIDSERLPLHPPKLFDLDEQELTSSKPSSISVVKAPEPERSPSFTPIAPSFGDKQDNRNSSKEEPSFPDESSGGGSGSMITAAKPTVFALPAVHQVLRSTNGVGFTNRSNPKVSGRSSQKKQQQSKGASAKGTGMAIPSPTSNIHVATTSGQSLSIESPPSQNSGRVLSFHDSSGEDAITPRSKVLLRETGLGIPMDNPQPRRSPVKVPPVDQTGSRVRGSGGGKNEVAVSRIQSNSEFEFGSSSVTNGRGGRTGGAGYSSRPVPLVVGREGAPPPPGPVSNGFRGAAGGVLPPGSVEVPGMYNIRRPSLQLGDDWSPPP